jgi:replicative DNA helicase
MSFTRKGIDTKIEAQIVTGMVVSDRFLQGVAPILRLEYLTSSYAKTVARWCLEFHATYNKAPQEHIQDIYDGYKRSGQTFEDLELIGEFLNRLSKHYEEEQGPFNVDYILDKAELYFKERALKLLVAGVDSHLAGGKVLEAQEEVATFIAVSRVATEGCEPFLDEVVVRNAFEADEEVLFTLPGDLGEMIGPFKREYLVAAAAPMKRGKSGMLLDIALQAYYSKLNVVVFNLEMSRGQVVERIARAVTGLPRRGGEYFFPLWDCLENQLGTCAENGLHNPTVAVNTRKGIERKPFTTPKYKTCIKCDKVNMSAWAEVKKLTGLTTEKAIQHLTNIGKMFPNSKFKLVTWPAYSAGLHEIHSCLRSWEYMEEFLPDIIVVDYADILKPDTKFLEERHNLDRIWKGLKALAQSTKTAVVTATQTRRSTLEKGDVGQADIAEDIRKLAHVDVMWGISQTPDEKRVGLARVGILGQRHDDFDVISQCYIIQQLKCGQFCLDSKFKR